MRRVGFPLFGDHVGKYGGTSLNELLARNLHRNQLGVAPFLTLVELVTLRASRFDHWH